MQQIADWLKELGMSEYVDRFAENHIDIGVLRDLTDQDLKDLGVVSIGHRRKMLRAISELAEAGIISSRPPATSPSKPRDYAERRQLTVMFCDLVGSTALSARLDPEDLRGIIGTYHRCCTEWIERNGGFVAKYMGDGVLAYFGYPKAHEHDAESAVRAGLNIVEAVPKLATQTGSPLQVRVGIATGLVVVGDLIGTGAAQEQAVIGETPNLAARLQALAEPGAVVIAASTRHLTGRLFEYRDLGTTALKGFAENVQAWQVLGASAIESRFEAMRSAMTPLVGRDEEIDLLLRRWEQAKSSDGQVLLISGEPGIGKSRIAQTVLERISAEAHTRLRYFCSPHHQENALYPSITQLERAAGFRREDTSEQRLAKLEAVLSQGTNDLSDAVPLLADLLSIPIGDRYAPLNLTPQKRKEKTLHAQLAQVEGLAARQPVLMVFEDAHWSDPTTRESLDLIVDRVATLRVLMIVTFRPEFTPAWIGRPHVTSLTLTRLPVRQRTQMIAQVTGGKALPKEIADQIVDRTDGVPLFIEELTKSVIESGIVTEVGDHYAAIGPVAPLAIPTSLHASLLARLDRLAPTREVAQIGAALGRRFSHELISAVAQIPQQQVDDALSQLVSAELIFKRGTPPDAEYTFKHALVQDAAYDTLLRSRRQQLHARIAATLEDAFPEIVAAQPALLARHCAEAGLTEKAIGYWLKAGQQAARRSLNQEAIHHLTNGLEQLKGRPDTVEKAKEELAFQTALGPALLATRGWASPAAIETYLRARALCEQVGDTTQLFTTLWGTWLFRWARGEITVARGLVDELLALAQRERKTVFRLQAHHAAWTTFTYLGEVETALEHAKRGMAIYQPKKHGSLASNFGGHDPGVCAKAHASQPLWLLGYPERAARSSRQSLELAQQLSHVPSVVHALFHGVWLDQFRRDEHAAQNRAEILINMAANQGQLQYVAIGTIFRGWALAAQGETKEGIEAVRQGVAEYRATGAESWAPYYNALLAELLYEAKCNEEALSVLHEAQIAAKKAAEQFFWKAEMMRLEGELLLSHLTKQGEAESCFGKAIAIARDLNMKSLELRISTSLARLWRDQGKRTQARDLLTPVYDWFAEGFDTLDLKEAKALLDELA